MLVITLQSQIKILQENLNKISVERDGMKKDLEAKKLEIGEKVKTIVQVKKLGRRYKNQYDELRSEQSKVSSIKDYLDGIEFIFIIIAAVVSLAQICLISLQHADNFSMFK